MRSFSGLLPYTPLCVRRTVTVTVRAMFSVMAAATVTVRVCPNLVRPEHSAEDFRVENVKVKKLTMYMVLVPVVLIQTAEHIPTPRIAPKTYIVISVQILSTPASTSVIPMPRLR